MTEIERLSQRFHALAEEEARLWKLHGNAEVVTAQKKLTLSELERYLDDKEEKMNAMKIE